MSDEKKPIDLALTDSQAWALAQFCKRVGWSEMRACAVDEAEAHVIREGISALTVALRLGGYAPR